MAEGKKLIKRFNIIDVIILLFVVLAVVMLLGRGFSKNVSKSSSGKELLYSVKVTNVRQFTVDSITVGKKLLDGQSGNEIGEIKSVRELPHIENQIMLDGTVKPLETPEKFDFYIEIAAKGVANDEGFFIGTTQIAPGENIGLVNEQVDTNGLIVSVQEK